MRTAMNSKYRLEFKRMACEMLLKYENSPSRVANELKIPIKTFEKWVSLYRRNPSAFNDDEISYEEENRALRKKIKEHEETIEILKKAYAFFTEKEKLSENALALKVVN